MGATARAIVEESAALAEVPAMHPEDAPAERPVPRWFSISLEVAVLVVLGLIFAAATQRARVDFEHSPAVLKSR